MEQGIFCAHGIKQAPRSNEHGAFFAYMRFYQPVYGFLSAVSREYISFATPFPNEGLTS